MLSQVSGPVDPSQLGVVLPHEQPMCDFTRLLLEPEPGFGNGKPLADLSITMENLGTIRKYPKLSLQFIVGRERSSSSRLEEEHCATFLLLVSGRHVCVHQAQFINAFAGPSSPDDV